jgi:hypothetical protein
LLSEKSFIVLKYAKTILEFWKNQKEEKMIKYVCICMSEVYQIFNINPRIKRKFIIQLASSLVNIEDSQAKLAILMACKDLMKNLGSEDMILFFKVLI